MHSISGVWVKDKPLVPPIYISKSVYKRNLSIPCRPDKAKQSDSKKVSDSFSVDKLMKLTAL